jgi:hypothetical protein
MTYEELKLEALKLSIERREELGNTLLRSIEEEDSETDPEIEHAVLQEVRRRYQMIMEGKDQLTPAEDVYAELLSEQD